MRLPCKLPTPTFTAPDPLAGSLTDPAGGERLSVPYISWLSPYAYCASDPINFTDPTGMVLMFKGDNPLVEEAVNILNKGCGQHVFEVETNGNVSVKANADISLFTPGQKTLYNTIKETIDAHYEVNLNIVNNDECIVIADVTSATVDIGDAKIVSKSGLTTPHSVLAHEINEQRKIQYSKANGTFIEDRTIPAAHFDSIQKEKYINSQNYYIDHYPDGNLKEPYSHDLDSENLIFRIILDKHPNIELNYIDVRTGKIFLRQIQPKP